MVVKIVLVWNQQRGVQADEWRKSCWVFLLGIKTRYRNARQKELIHPMKSFILRSWIFSARLQLETLIQRELRVGLKLHSPAWLAGGLGLLLSAVGATGQSTFQNLDFEMATLTPAPPWGVRQRISAANALPYWTVREDTTVFTTIWGAYDIDWTAVTLVCPDTYDPYGGLSYPSLQGVYSVQLSACTMNPDFKSSSISQTGLIPVGMNSIWFQMESPPFAGGGVKQAQS